MIVLGAVATGAPGGLDCIGSGILVTCCCICAGTAFTIGGTGVGTMVAGRPRPVVARGTANPGPEVGGILTLFAVFTGTGTSALVVGFTADSAWSGVGFCPFVPTGKGPLGSTSVIGSPKTLGCSQHCDPLRFSTY